MVVVKTVKVPAFEFQWNLVLYPHKIDSVRIQEQQKFDSTNYSTYRISPFSTL